jgi:hypothetical protein
VIPDEARAEIFIRLVGDSAATKARHRAAAGGQSGTERVLEIPGAAAHARGRIAHHRGRLHHRHSRHSAARGAAVLLIGPGTIHVAHTLDERVPKQQLEAPSKSIKNGQAITNDVTMKKNRSRHPRRHRHGGPAFHQISRRASVVRPHVAGRERALRRQAYHEAAAWHLGGAARTPSPALTVEEAKPGNAPQAAVLRHGRLRRHRDRAGLRAGRARGGVEFAQPSHGSRRAAAGARNQSRSPEAHPRPAARARLERADRHQSELLHHRADHGARPAEAVRHHARHRHHLQAIPARAIRACLPWTSTAT